MKKFSSVDEYIENAPTEIRNRLKQIRSIIKAIAPTATERISYGMPYYEYKTRLAYFGYAKEHIGLYIPGPTILEHEKDLKTYSHTKATIRFPNTHPLPIPLIQTLIKSRLSFLDNSPKLP